MNQRTVDFELEAFALPDALAVEDLLARPSFLLVHCLHYLSYITFQRLHSLQARHHKCRSGFLRIGQGSPNVAW